ncbi:PREDICTED: CAAX prenyl protease 2-like [Thamnophis sirtalis]|uniref:CAAX prenyl protease 2 n=1 Tax=Thamnophis sirtalis TaxID=35019 RepID=A0A6I9X9D6_9SAUR|nr:PREDICTED: CAAX prenyl protease 2-like [Thamnophis sirtalis]
MSAEGEEGSGGAGPGLCWASLFSCLGLACSYVGSLYVWKSHLPRDHPAVIKRRFTSVLVVSTFSPLFIWVWKEVTGIKVRTPCLSRSGRHYLEISGVWFISLEATFILFLGPLIQLSMDCPWDMVDGLRVAFDPRFWVLCLTDMRWLRNQVIAPFTEELVFRACMVPMLVPCTGVGLAIVTCPLFFGVGEFLMD